MVRTEWFSRLAMGTRQVCRVPSGKWTFIPYAYHSSAAQRKVGKVKREGGKKDEWRSVRRGKRAW